MSKKHRHDNMNPVEKFFAWCFVGFIVIVGIAMFYSAFIGN